jgi:hypothetical protein
MKKYNLNDLIEFDSSKINPKILINESGYRMVLMSMRAGQSTPEHSTPGMVTVYALRGYITFHVGQVLRTESKPMKIQPSWFWRLERPMRRRMILKSSIFVRFRAPNAIRLSSRNSMPWRLEAHCGC